MLHVSSVPEFILQGLSVGKNAGVSELGHGVAAGVCGFICNMAGKGVYSLLSRAYYYVGSICRDMDDIKRAVAFYRKAAEEIVDDRDFGLKSNAYSQIGRLMMLQSDCNMAARYYCLSYQTDSARRDTTAMVHSLLYMSMAYQREGRFDDGVSCLYRAVALGEKAKLGLRYDAYHRLSLLLCDSGDYNQAWRYVQYPLRLADYGDRDAVCATAMDICVHTGRIDSARVLCKQLMQSNSAYARRYAANALVKISGMSDQHGSAAKYIDSYVLSSDSVDMLESCLDMSDALPTTERWVVDDEISLLKADLHDSRVVLLGVSSLLGVVTLFLFFANARYGAMRQKHSLGIAKLQNKVTDFIVQSGDKMIEASDEIRHLMQKLHESACIREELEAEVAQHKSRLQASMEASSSEAVMRNVRDSRLVGSEAFALAKSRVAVSKPLSQAEWLQAEEELGCILVGFKEALYSAHNISEHEYRICLLVKMGFSNKEIGILICRAANAVSLARKRLYKKLTGRDGTASDFDDLIKSL